ncbi:hypothetical protein K438DRAFT_1775547 [Mycena galopus ATCC 62051]|nr:hypothetical protein K438DRAFT_1775547 [Mycena galopus ATCC 62051]
MQRLQRCRFAARGDHEHSLAAKPRTNDHEKRTWGGNTLMWRCLLSEGVRSRHQKRNLEYVHAPGYDDDDIIQKEQTGFPEEVLGGAEDARGSEWADRRAGGACFAGEATPGFMDLRLGVDKGLELGRRACEVFLRMWICARRAKAARWRMGGGRDGQGGRAMGNERGGDDRWLFVRQNAVRSSVHYQRKTFLKAYSFQMNFGNHLEARFLKRVEAPPEALQCFNGA